MNNKLSLKNIIYPSIILFIAALTIFSLVKSIAFISESINMVFSTDAGAGNHPVKVDTVDYLIAAKKLGLPTGISQ